MWSLEPRVTHTGRELGLGSFDNDFSVIRKGGAFGTQNKVGCRLAFGECTKGSLGRLVSVCVACSVGVT